MPRSSADPEDVAIAEQEDKDWQRLDKWLWCARFMRARSDCAVLAGEGRIRINRQVTEKAHARLRIGDVLTVPVGRSVRVVRVLELAIRRGPPAEARRLYEDLTAPDGPQPAAAGSATEPAVDAVGAASSDPAAASCAGDETPAYRPV